MTDVSLDLAEQSKALPPDVSKISPVSETQVAEKRKGFMSGILDKLLKRSKPIVESLNSTTLSASEGSAPAMTGAQQLEAEVHHAANAGFGNNVSGDEKVQRDALKRIAKSGIASDDQKDRLLETQAYEKVHKEDGGTPLDFRVEQAKTELAEEVSRDSSSIADTTELQEKKAA